MTRQEILDATIKAVNETPEPQRTVENIVFFVLNLVGKKEDKPVYDRLNMVEQFHKVFKHYIGDKPEIPALEVVNLRKELIAEEAQELTMAAYSNGHKEDALVECLDALCDLEYVLLGTIEAYGFQNIFDKAFAEVHRSNMSKGCKTAVEAVATVNTYKEKGIDCYYDFDTANQIYLVYRTSDKKTLKSINYSPADLKQFLVEPVVEGETEAKVVKLNP